MQHTRVVSVGNEPLHQRHNQHGVACMRRTRRGQRYSASCAALVCEVVSNGQPICESCVEKLVVRHSHILRAILCVFE
jgi:hypothetical protein